MTFSRPSWHDVRLAMAAELAKRSLCVRDQVGAVIVDVHNKIIGEGYNGPPRGYQHNNKSCWEWCPRVRMAQSGTAHGMTLDYTDCPSLHAEANALLQADRSLCLGGTIFVTSHVCYGCAKLIANSGLRQVVVRSARRDYRPVRATLDFLRTCEIEVVTYENEREESA